MSRLNIIPGAPENAVVSGGGHLAHSDMISTLIPALARAHRKLAGTLLREVGLSAGQELLLMLLWDSEPRSQSELTRHFAVEPPTTAKMLARLERAGLVTRERLPSDRRNSLVSLTETGRALESPVRAVWRELEARTVEALTPQEQDQLAALLGRVTHSLVDEREERSTGVRHTSAEPPPVSAT